MSESLDLHAWDDCGRCRGQQRILVASNQALVARARRRWLDLGGLVGCVDPWCPPGSVYDNMCECAPARSFRWSDSRVMHGAAVGHRLGTYPSAGKEKPAVAGFSGVVEDTGIVSAADVAAREA